MTTNTDKKKEIIKGLFGTLLLPIAGRRKLTELALKGLGAFGDAINTAATAGASTDFGLTSPFTFSTSKERKNIAKGREKVRLKAKREIEDKSVYLSPSSHVVAWTQGSLNPRVGALKIAEWGPEAQLLSAATDIATFAKGPKVIKTTGKATKNAVVNTAAKAGSKKAKAAVVSKEINNAVDNTTLKDSSTPRTSHSGKNYRIEKEKKFYTPTRMNLGKKTTFDTYLDAFPIKMSKPFTYDALSNMFIPNKNYYYRRGWGIIDDALETKRIRVPEGDYKSIALKKYPQLDNGNPFSTALLNHKFPYFAEGKLWDAMGKFGVEPEDLIAVPKDAPGVEWVAGSKYGSLLKDKKPSEAGGRATPLVNGETNQLPTSASLLFRYNKNTGRYEPLNTLVGKTAAKAAISSKATQSPAPRITRLVGGVPVEDWVRKFIAEKMKTDPAITVKEFLKPYTIYGEPYARGPFANDFVPLAISDVGTRNIRFAEGMLQRLKDQGYRTDLSVPVIERGITTLRSPNSFIPENALKRVYIGYYPEEGTLGGHFEPLTDRAVIDPSRMPPPMTMLHERIMHGTDNLIEALERVLEGKAKSMYEDFSKKLFTEEIPEEAGGGSTLAKNLIQNSDGTFTVVDPKSITNGYKTVLNADKWYEVRSTVGELRRNLEWEFEKQNPEFREMSPADPTYKKAFNDYIDTYNDNLLMGELTNKTNGYGETYGVLHENNPSFFPDLRNLIKYGAMYGAPMTIGGYTLYNLYNNQQPQSHKKGGKMKKHQGFVNGVNVLDSNPNIYKKIKHRKKVKKALEGTKFSTWLNNNKDTISGVLGLAMSAISSIKLSHEQKRNIEALKRALEAGMEADKEAARNAAYKKALEKGTDRSAVVNAFNANNEANTTDYSSIDKLYQLKINNLDWMLALNQANSTGDFINAIGGIAGTFLNKNNKSISTSASVLNNAVYKNPVKYDFTSLISKTNPIQTAANQIPAKLDSLTWYKQQGL